MEPTPGVSMSLTPSFSQGDGYVMTTSFTSLMFFGLPLYEVLVKRFIMQDIAGATVYKAIAGYGPHKCYHKKKTLAAHGELPILITVLDKEENINKLLPVLDELVAEGIVVLSDVNVIKYTHRDAEAGLP